MKILLVLLSCFAVTMAVYGPSTSNPMVCYYTNWSQYRPGQGKFMPENIDPFLCNFIPYAFVNLKDAPCRIENREWNEDQMIERVMALKGQNPDLKVTVAVGGWNAASTVFSPCVSTAAKRTEFVSNIIQYMHAHGFDGVDLDWEYPGSRGGNEDDKENLNLFVKELREALDNEPGQYYYLTAAVAAGADKIEQGYDGATLCQYLDFVHIMTYDYFGAWNSWTDHHSPVYYGAVNYTGSVLELYNIHSTAMIYLNSNCPAEKLVMGIPTYGRGFTLTDENNRGYDAPASGACTAGTYTREAGFLSYYEICGMEAANDAFIQWDQDTLAPVVVQGNQWLGFDNKLSIKNKVRHAKELGIGGMMVWSLDLDDFNGQFCGQGSYPLIKTVVNEFFGDGECCSDPTLPCYCGGTTEKPNVDTTTTTSKGPTTTSTSGNGNGQATTTTTTASSDNFCDGKPDGNYADPNDNTIFHQCAHGTDNIQNCPSGTVYNGSVCNWP